MTLSQLRLRFLILPIFLGLLSCPAFPSTEEELQQDYANAIQDASVVTADEIDTNLTPITEENPDLIWSGEAGNRQVLMVTWTSWTGYDDLVGKTIRMTRYLTVPVRDALGNTVMSLYDTTRDIWVTAVPEIQRFCQSNPLSPEERTLRLEQLLGVPPHNGKTRFVEFWVKPGDLFRPTPDPDITTTISSLEFPADVSEEHLQWFNDLMATSYGENGYPWTRLGYTYDWGKSDHHIGLSEFVIRTGAEVDVDSVTFTDDYCQSGSGADHWSLYE